MSAIIKRFQIRLTRKQHEQIKEMWDSVNCRGAAMVACQPVAKEYRAFYTGSPSLRFAVLDDLLAQAINKLVREHKNRRP